MTIAKLKLAEALGLGMSALICFPIFNAVDGTRPLITEFEAGAIAGVVLLKLIEALHAYIGPRS
jgi:hypothetical protein